MSYIKWFKDIRKNERSIVGGKGYSLAILTKAEFSVPDGFIITKHAFNDFLEENKIKQLLSNELLKVNYKNNNSVEKHSNFIRNQILKHTLSKDLLNEIISSFDKIRTDSVAVRSSAIAEDSLSASWAGELESYLGVAKENLERAVVKCWASFFTSRALIYRSQENLSIKDMSIAVVIQKMIKSKISGVCFTVHPTSQDATQIVIEAGLGSGENVVGGKIIPDRYTVSKNNFVLLDKFGQNILTRLQIIKLAKICHEIEKVFKYPSDIEWVLEDDRFYIVQCRPITTLQKKKVAFPNLDIDSYERLFEVKSIPYLISEIFSTHYVNLDCLLINFDNTWTVYLPKKTIDRTLEEGVKLYRDNQLFNEYQSDFQNYIKNSSIFFTSIFKKSKLTKEQLRQFLVRVSSFHQYYVKTEFFYTDRAYYYSNSNQLIKSNLIELEKIKKSGREYLNKIFFGEQSFISRLLKKIENQFKVKSNELIFYSKEDLIDLFDNRKVSKEMIMERKKTFVMIGTNRVIKIVAGKRAYNWIQDFLRRQSKDNILKGVVANYGKVRGKVKIIPADYKRFDQINDIVEKMEHGDILVAETTSPELIVACRKAGAIVTNQGGMMSHAAIISRELGIPCVVGTLNATKVLKNGELVEVDAIEGVVKK